MKLFTTDWDLNPCAGTQTHPKPSLGLEPTWLGLKNPAITHSTWFQGLIKLMFLMSHHRKNSVRDKVIGKKCSYSDSERSTLHSMLHRRGWEPQQNVGWLVLTGWVISYGNEWEGYSNYFGEGMEMSRIWATTHSLVFWQCLGSVMAPLGVPFHLLIPDQGLACLPSWSHLILISSCYILGLCYSFKSCALPLSLLLHLVRSGLPFHLRDKESNESN